MMRCITTVLAVAMTAACASGEDYTDDLTGDITPAEVVVVSAPASMMPGDASDTITVRVRSQAGEPVPDQVVTWSTTEAQAALAVVDSVSDAKGFARALFTPGPRLGQQRVTATVGTLPTATIDVNATSGAWRVVVGACGVASNGVLACFRPVGGIRNPIRVGTELYLSLSGDWTANGYCASRVTGGVDCFQPTHAMPVVQPVAGVSPPLVQISSTYGAFCGLTAAGEAWCWGLNRGGRLGDGTQTDLSTLTPVLPAYRFTQLLLGDRHGCGLETSGDVYCWGRNLWGELGLPPDMAVRTPQKIGSLPPSTAIAMAPQGTNCALGVDRLVRCWGVDEFGLLGRLRPPGAGPADPIPAPIGNVGAARAVIGTATGFAAIDVSGRTYFWGQMDMSWVRHPTVVMSPSALAFVTGGGAGQACVIQSGHSGVVCLSTNAFVLFSLFGIVDPYNRLFYGLPSPPP